MKTNRRLLILMMMVICMATVQPAFAGSVQKLQTGEDTIISNEVSVEKSEAENVGSDSGSGLKVVSSVKYQKVHLKNTASGVLVSWNFVKDSPKYQVYKKVGDTWKLLITAKKNSYVDPNPTKGKYNRYAVKTMINRKYQKAVYSSIVYLAKPDFTLTALKNGVKVEWKKVAGAKAYRVYKKAPGTTAYKKLVETAKLSINDTGFGRNNGKYSYYVVAVRDTYKSSYGHKLVSYTHQHSNDKTIKRSATKFVYGIADLKCRTCGYESRVATMPTIIGKYLLDDYAEDLELAKTYEIALPGLSYYSDREAFDPVDPITKPRYMMDKDGIYKSLEVKKDGTATIMFTGDAMCQRYQIRTAYNKYGCYRFNDEFEYVKDLLGSSDFAVTNLETMLRDGVTLNSESIKVDNIYHCNGPSTFLGGLRYAGFDMAVTANNHNCDVGVKGVFETLSHLDQYGFIHTGMFRNTEEKRYKIVEIDGIKVAFLSYAVNFNSKNNYWTQEGQDILLNNYTQERCQQDVEDAKAEGAEYIITYMHSGVCYAEEPSDMQMERYQEMADAGVDYIVGSHPHVLQKYDEILSADGRIVPVMCSLGNFVSHMQAASERNLTAILQIELKKSKDGQVYLASNGYIPAKTFQQYKGMDYATVPLTKPYNTEGYDGYSDIKTEYKAILNRVGEKIELLGTFDGK